MIALILPRLQDVQHLYTWVGLVGGVAAVLCLAFYLVESVEDALVKMRDEDTQPHGVVIRFPRRVR